MGTCLSNLVDTTLNTRKPREPPNLPCSLLPSQFHPKSLLHKCLLLRTPSPPTHHPPPGVLTPTSTYPPSIPSLTLSCGAPAMTGM